MKSAWKIWLWLARPLLAAVFIGASFPKIQDPQAFALIVYRYHLLPSPLVNPFALFLPWLEFLCGLSLLAGHHKWRAAAAALTSAMLLLFTLAISANLLRGIHVACGCFSTDPASTIADTKNILRNLLLLLPALSLLFAPPPTPPHPT